MRWVAIFVLLAGFASAQTKSPVMVELFTSEGCSSCPPADQLLVKLEKYQPVQGAEIIVLGEHVDYWDGPGWHDRFSSRQFTNRQENYARHFGLNGPYTPEMVVNGHDEFNGSDGKRALSNIQRAAAVPATAAVSLQRIGDRLHVDVANASKHRLDVMMAIAEDGLSTQVRGGENGGHELHHTGVVRELTRLGSTRDGRFSGDIPLHLDQSWNRANLHAVVFLQEGSAGEVVSAGQIPLQ